MVRHLFYALSVLSLITISLIYLVWPPVLYFLFLALPLIGLGIYDLLSSHNVLRNYPVIGHLRYMFEFIRPEIQQYFVATNLSGVPYNREQRTMVYQRAHNEDDTHPFGTEHKIDEQAYHYAQHSIAAIEIKDKDSRIDFGGPQCKKPYNASRINISAMSYGALGKNAVLAMNLGAKIAGCAQNTGEGGLTPHHLKFDADVIMQLGTAYFGCRTKEGKFSEELFKQKSHLPQVKMIEVKISQGAKPSHGGLLPAAKITKEIADIRGIEPGVDCLSPPTHSEFSTPIGLLEFVQRLRDMSGGKPVGFKICIGRRAEFMGICKAMLKTGIYPDFITIDGAEGGTGAAPIEFTNRFGVPACEALAFVHNCLVGTKLRDKMRLISSGKVVSGFDVAMRIGLGADTVNIARPMMFSVGCIQALRCHTNTCPTGVATQDPHRYRALIVKEKGPHVANFQRNTMKSFLTMLGAMGLDTPDNLNAHMFFHRITEGESDSYYDLFNYIEPGHLLQNNVDDIHGYYREYWQNASAEQFPYWRYADSHTS